MNHFRLCRLCKLIIEIPDPKVGSNPVWVQGMYLDCPEISLSQSQSMNNFVTFIRVTKLYRFRFVAKYGGPLYPRIMYLWFQVSTNGGWGLPSFFLLGVIKKPSCLWGGENPKHRLPLIRGYRYPQWTRILIPHGYLSMPISPVPATLHPLKKNTHVSWCFCVSIISHVLAVCAQLWCCLHLIFQPEVFW